MENDGGSGGVCVCVCVYGGWGGLMRSSWQPHIGIPLIGVCGG